MKPWLIRGDCVPVMRQLDADSVDAIVTDPPYGLEFMGKEWDRLDWTDGGGMAAAGIGERAIPWPSYGAAGPAGAANATCAICGGRMRCEKRCSCAAPDWRVRGEPLKQDANANRMQAQQAWHHAWAVEALRVLKPGGHLLAFGGSRTFHRLACAVEDAGFEIRDTIMWLYGSGFPKSLDVSKAIDKAAGAERAVVGYDATRARPNRQYEAGAIGNIGGTGSVSDRSDNGATLTAPATEAARRWAGWGTALKPAHEPIIVARKPLIGTVAANVQAHGTGALNIDGCRVAVDKHDDIHKQNPHTVGGFGHAGAAVYGKSAGAPVYDPSRGRWPANVIMDEEAGAMLDAQTGNLAPGASPAKKGLGSTRVFGDQPRASRFFYCAKASRSERGEGNVHPTVKPIALMRYLCRLVTPPGGLVLDPFAGSGTTGIAALAEGFRFIGIEREVEYLEIARGRLEAANNDAR